MILELCTIPFEMVHNARIGRGIVGHNARIGGGIVGVLAILGAIMQTGMPTAMPTTTVNENMHHSSNDTIADNTSFHNTSFLDTSFWRYMKECHDVGPCTLTHKNKTHQALVCDAVFKYTNDNSSSSSSNCTADFGIPKARFITPDELAAKVFSLPWSLAHVQMLNIGETMHGLPIALQGMIANQAMARGTKVINTGSILLVKFTWCLVFEVPRILTGDVFNKTYELVFTNITTENMCEIDWFLFAQQQVPTDLSRIQMFTDACLPTRQDRENLLFSMLVVIQKFLEVIMNEILLVLNAKVTTLPEWYHWLTEFLELLYIVFVLYGLMSLYLKGRVAQKLHALNTVVESAKTSDFCTKFLRHSDFFMSEREEAYRSLVHKPCPCAPPVLEPGMADGKRQQIQRLDHMIRTSDLLIRRMQSFDRGFEGFINQNLSSVTGLILIMTFFKNTPDACFSMTIVCLWACVLTHMCVDVAKGKQIMQNAQCNFIDLVLTMHPKGNSKTSVLQKKLLNGNPWCSGTNIRDYSYETREIRHHVLQFMDKLHSSCIAEQDASITQEAQKVSSADMLAAFTANVQEEFIELRALLTTVQSHVFFEVGITEMSKQSLVPSELVSDDLCKVSMLLV